MMSDTIKPPVTDKEVIKVSGSDYKEARDVLAIEEPLEIRIGFGSVTERKVQNLSVTMRTPGNDAELAVGFLFTEGIIHSYDQVERVHSREENVIQVELKPDVLFSMASLQRNFFTTSSCGVCGKASIDAVKVSTPSPVHGTFSFSPALVHSLPEKLRDQQRIFDQTGGLHAAAVFLNGEVLFLREDVGRHNAVDKVIGTALMNNAIPLSEAVLLVSGRASFELVQKAVMAGIPVLAAVGAPSSLAVSLAEESGMTLLGFVREMKFNVYTHAHRMGTSP
jgi:FdhD protein